MSFSECVRLDVRPWSGLGPLCFGMPPDEVRRLLPEEEEAREDWGDGTSKDSLFYRGLALEFDASDAQGPLASSRLVSVEVLSRENVWLFGRSLESWSLRELRDRAKLRGWSVSCPSSREFRLISLGLCVGFGSQGIADFLELREPSLRIETVWPTSLVFGAEVRAEFWGKALADEFSNLRDGTRWLYREPDLFCTADPQATLGRGDVLLPGRSRVPLD